MTKIAITSALVSNTTCPAGQKKLNLFDTSTKGLGLEVRATGGRTFYLRYQDSRGRTRQFRLADAADVTLRQARDLADKARNRIAMGEDPNEAKAKHKQVPTLATFVADSYLPFVKGYKRSWTTDECLLRNHVLPKLGAKYLDEITKQDIIALHHGRRAEGAAPGSANRLLIILRYVFNLAVRWDIPGVSANPTKDVALFEENNKMERFLSPEEAQRLYEAVCASDNQMLRFIVPMLVLTGARKREVLDAQWADFDLEHRNWRIPMCKTGKVRHVPLSDGALQVLAQVPKITGLPFVFANPKTQLPFVSIFCSWNTARKQADLQDVRMHDLRHSFASFLVNAGRSLYEVQKILGHTQVKTTQRYAHLAQQTLVDAANAAVKALGAAFMPAQGLLCGAGLQGERLSAPAQVTCAG
jgi:integrase